MKKTAVLLLSIPFALLACNNEGKDSVEKADSANEAKTDTSNHTNNTLAVDKSTSDFMVDAANGGMTEVQGGKLAEQKAVSARVKAFGSMMVRDHSNANEELKSLAGRKNVTLPATVSEENQKMIDDYNKKSSKDFDKDYIDMMVKDHETDVKDFEKASNDVKDADVKAFIDKTLPTLRAHLDSARAIQKAIKH
jgi:putative membrane protein